MNMKNIRVRKEVLKCSKCKSPQSFLYLSDFSYGERLLFVNEGTEYAFINLIEDKIYTEYEEQVINILQENSIELKSDIVNKIIIETFGITCDEINGHQVDFSQTQKKCHYCGSTEFGRNMIEPESLIEIEVPLISHGKWNTLNIEQKEKSIEDELKLKMII